MGFSIEPNPLQEACMALWELVSKFPMSEALFQGPGIVIAMCDMLAHALQASSAVRGQVVDLQILNLDLIHRCYSY